MPTVRGAKTKKHSKKDVHAHKTRNHSNLRPKQKHSNDFLKVYYPYLPLLLIVFAIAALINPWHPIGQTRKGVLRYATSMSIRGLAEATNLRRAAKAEEPLKVNTKLNLAAQKKAQDMVVRNYWSHVTPSGMAPWEFVNDAGYSYKKAGENLAYGFDTETQVLSAWMNSPAHRENVLEPAYRDVGFGFAQSTDFVNDGPTTVVVAMYGQPASGPTSQSDNFTPAIKGISDATPTNISKIQLLTNGSSPWISYAVGFIIGGIVVYLSVKHGRALKRAAKQGERYILHHPLVDITFVALVALGIILLQQVGVIL